MSDQIAFLWQNIPNLMIGFPGHRPGGLLLSVMLAVAAIMLGFVVAVLLGTAYETRFRSLRLLVYLYIEVFRGIPLILLLLVIHQLLGNGRHLGFNPPPLISAFVALTLYSSAYQAEIIRAGLQAIPVRMVETARLIGCSRRQVYQLIKLRYALHVMLPAFTGQAISLFKDSSVVVIIGVADLMTVARVTLGSDVVNAPYWVGLYLVVGLLYFAVAFTVSRLAQDWERRHHSSDLVHSLVNY